MLCGYFANPFLRGNMKPTYPRFVFVMVLLLCLSGCATLKDYQGQALDRKTSIVITEYGQHGKTSSIGGISYEISYYNLSGKTIRYLTVYVTPYNIVGNVMPSKTNMKTKAELMQIGPIETETKTSFMWDNVWFNRAIYCIELNSIEINYTDGSFEALNSEEVQKALYQPRENDNILPSCK
jgi:hypothetical protein